LVGRVPPRRDDDQNLLTPRMRLGRPSRRGLDLVRIRDTRPTEFLNEQRQRGRSRCTICFGGGSHITWVIMFLGGRGSWEGEAPAEPHSGRRLALPKNLRSEERRVGKECR